ncbi:hypothetical protein [Streptomyces sp. NPDC006739]|uniref:hypothetical protein n=1 Tax=Streptomyces sp. NPDC006739 TaxID=3364763 RepID=UPI0036BD49E6
MTGTAALRPVGTEPSTLVHSSADRRLATEHWLLSTRSAPSQARLEWQEQGVALLPLGTLFSAVRIPARLVHSIAGTEEADDTDEFLEDALDGGPVICDPHGRRYYVLVPAGMPRTWRHAADEWRSKLDVELLGRGTYLGVPRLTDVRHNPHTYASYWAVPMHSPAALCTPLRVTRLLTTAHHQLVDEAG